MWEVTGWQVYTDYYIQVCGEEFVMITVVELNFKSTVRSIELSMTIRFMWWYKLYVQIKFMPLRNYRFYRNGILENLYSYACKFMNF